MAAPDVRGAGDDMLPEDVFNRGYEAVVAELERMVTALEPVARVDRERAPTFWRTRLTPHTRNACPMELVIHRNQRFDLVLDTEVAEGQLIGALSMFPKIVAAVSGGRVVLRTHRAQATGASVAREAIVSLGEGDAWSNKNALLASSSDSEHGAVYADRHFTPYARH
ncbi:MAG: hypothetical protein ABL898_02250 [Hyphomicrobiaceae bacterium]|nr:hypothetical protein [Hyphomicrobiaceae bacterium]